jgi:tryptophan synthase alpha subunit
VVGDGVFDAGTVEVLDELMDAAVFGSALIRHIDVDGNSAGLKQVWK